jgi:hypothetical protein
VNIDRHTEQATAVAKETGWQIDADADEREWAGIGLGPAGQTRDSDALARSNFSVISDDLRERYPDDFDISSFSHWACGWIEEMIWNVGNADLRDRIEHWRDKLDNCPVADEEHYSELETDELSEYLSTEIPYHLGQLDETDAAITAGAVAEKIQETGDVSRVDDMTERTIPDAIAEVRADLKRTAATPPTSQLQLVAEHGRPMVGDTDADR